MSIEARVNIKATFNDEEKAKTATSELKKSLKKNQHELASALDSLNPVQDQDKYKEETIHVEEIKRSGNVLSISSYTYTSEEPIWFVASLAQLGADRIFIRGQWDGNGRNYYFLNGEKVAKKIFDGEKPEKPLSQKDLEINKNLFLPEGRVTVKARLVSTWSVGDIYESTGMEFKMEDGTTFYYEGRGQLVDLFWNSEKGDYDTSLAAEFNAAFERGKLKGEYASFAKRPTKVLLSK